MTRPDGIQYTTSSLLADRTPAWRSHFVMVVMALGFVVLVARAAYVQIIGSDFFLRQGEVRFARTIELPGNRGRLLDRNGLILASSVPAASIWAIPEDVNLDDPHTREQLPRLAKLMDMGVGQLRGKLDGDRSFVWLKRQLDWEVGQQIRALRIPGIHQTREYRREYPEGEAAAHIVGFTSVEDKGQEGMELAFERELAGRAGSRRVIKDRLGRVVEGVGEEVPPVDGRDIQLSIDSKVQFFAYQRLKEQVLAHNAMGGSVVVMDAHTGELLALANYPSFDPGNRRRLTGEQLRNRAITDVFEPGSTMKPITVGIALESGKFQPSSLIDTSPGRITVTGSTISDTRNYGTLSVEGVIQKSSTVGTTKIAAQLTSRQMWEAFSAVGFGQRPQIAFPGAAAGRLRPYSSWRPIEKATMSYGYGLSASLLQMTRAYTVFSNEGRVIPATMLKLDAPPVGVPVFSPETARAVRQMLALATGPGGTGQRAQTVGYSVGGKSGTARKLVGREYSTNRYRAWFTGMAPIDEPRVIVSVMIDEPSNGVYYGGAVAAPVFSSVVQQTLRFMGVQPDMAVQPRVVTNAVEESL